MLHRRAVLAGLCAGPVVGRNVENAHADPDPLLAAGSMLIMGFFGADPESTDVQAVAGHLGSGRIGGVILFDDNLPSPPAARVLINHLKSRSKPRQPFVAVDQEGGAVVRLSPARGFQPLPPARVVARMPDADIGRLYARTAQDLHGVGINLNFAPVVDVDRNPRNPIIGALGRSFGPDPERVIADAKIFIDAHRHSHVLTALKHFPGHGSSRTDSHLALPDVTGLWSEAEELKPFAALIGSGYADMVMVGHITDRDLTEDGRPASLSPRVILDLLRRRLGFDGVVVSDDMQMGAIRRSYSPDESILLALEAGVDLFVYSNREHSDPEMPARFHRVIRSAIASGRLSPARIGESARRIARLKQALT